MLETYRYLFSFFGKKSSSFSNLDFIVERDDNLQLRGFKVAILNDPYTPSFSGFSHGFYTSNAHSRCKYSDRHNFNINCTCGFYSYKNKLDALKKANLREGSVILEVENYGEIVEYDHGFRSEQQEVLAIYFNQDCYKRNCTHQTMGIVFRYGNYFPTCLKHSNRSLITFKKLRSTLNLEISTVSFSN